MFFLSKAGANQWVLRPVGRGGGMGFESAFFQIPTTSSSASLITSTVASSVNDLIAVELAAGLQAYTGSSQNYSLYQMQSSLIAVPDSPVVQSLFQTLRTSPKLEPRFLALARAMKLGDTSALAEVAANVALLPQLTARAFASVGIVAQGYSGSSAQVGPLGVIAQSSDVLLQRSAANALMSIHTQDTLPFLAGLLDSSDAATRELAIKGLSCFVDNLPSITHYNVINGNSIQRQGPTPYRTAQTDEYSLSTRRLVDGSETESAFLQFWKGWWAKVKQQLAPGQ